jgi:DNA-binding MarR family transcriptional regulator
MCDSLRQATRTVTRLYDEALRPAKLRITQFSVLAELARGGEKRVRDVSAALYVEETTLSRNLRLLEKRGWVRSRPGADRRERLFAITGAGVECLTRARPLWQAAQERLRARLSRLSETAWKELIEVLPKLAGASDGASASPSANGSDGDR